MSTLLAIYLYLGSALFVATIIVEQRTLLTKMTVKDLAMIFGAPITWPVILLVAIYKAVKQ